MFAILFGISRADLEAMSVPEMTDHIDFWAERNEGGQDG